MPPLPTQLRNRLEAAVKQARRTAEAAAKVALERLTVGSAEPGTHLSVDERQLRNRLRAHGRQLGDQRDPKTGTQSINRLLHECAYEHWHRMLFARFLAENHLLIHDKEGMPVTLAECDELAADEGAPDGWTLAARYAARMLPQIFRPDDPVLQVGFAPEHKRALEKLVTELPVEVFTAEDSLGWVYQFWQAERKDEVNASGDKITGETLPAVTQLFTEHYMVLFLLHNSIGAWWAARQKSEGRVQKSEWDKCQTEDDCRKLVALPGYEFTYLRFIKDGNGEWVPAAGGFPGWPKSLKDFKLLDPCCGSGHFLVAAFVLLVLMRMQDEKLSANDACDAVLRENLHGLELDPRCTQIAAFALALTAWKFTEGFRSLPPLNIACSGLGVNAQKEDWLKLANGNANLRFAMGALYDLFRKAPTLGSLINPRRDKSVTYSATLRELQPLLHKALQREDSDDAHELAVTAQGVAKAADVLAGKFTVVATNVPYLGRGNQDDLLKDYCESVHPEAKNDLATCFVERCLDFADSSCTVALVTPQNWFSQPRYKKLRTRLLVSSEWNAVARLGPGAFATIGGEVVTVSLVTMTNRLANRNAAMVAIDASEEPTVENKAEMLASGSFAQVSQSSQLKNPDSIITLDSGGGKRLLNELARAWNGIVTGDDNRFYGLYWERPVLDQNIWTPVQQAPQISIPFTGCETVIKWENARGDLHLRSKAHNFPPPATVGKVGIAIQRMVSLNVCIFSGHVFDDSVSPIIPDKPDWLPAIYAFCQSDEFKEAVRRINHQPKVIPGALTKVPFDLAYWQKVAAEIYPHGLPKPHSDDPTQWLFNGHPKAATAPLQVAVARLLGYRWPRQNGSSFSDCSALGPDGLEQFADEDGIVCIPSVRGEAPAAERLRALLTAAYGKAWSPGKLDELLSAVDYAGSNLEDWLRNGFFDQHSKLFHQRPFIWQIWDGRKDGFSALVNYHKLDHKLLEKLTYTYLGDWIKKQQKAVANEEAGADDRLLKAQQLQDKLKLILEGEGHPDPDPEKSWGYDIFVRWKPLEQQPIGWHPDLNDGVRLNIRPFMEADVLRKRPNIKWGKDRGKNPTGSPWGEERDNDRHLTLDEKRKAQGKS